MLLASIFLSSALAIPEIVDRTSGFQSFDGFMKFYWDETEGKIWLEIERLREEFLYVNSMATGVGSNDIGLDRTQLGSQKLVYFDRRGPKVLLIQPNLLHRAEETTNPLESQAVRDAFAESVIWSFKIEAESGGRILVDLTEMLIQDHRNISARLKMLDEGSFGFDQNRSAIYLPRTKNFPDNTEFEVTITLTGSNPGPELISVAPTPEIVTVRQHHSIIRLPEPYNRREYHVMCGYIPISFRDYSSPIGEDMTKRFIPRHRLEKKNPDLALSEPLEPIIYYLDPATPEPVRSALIEGGLWWSQAFEAAGFQDAFRIEILPDDADPMDVRYNVINWLHRSTRGWSYGASIVDPRTGEILKGHVNLGSLRIRQDYLIAEALLNPYESGVPEKDSMLQMGLARIRQLSAHEIGHTLGLMHNFAASSNDRASVMDYPHPRITRREDGSVDLLDAYDTGIGEWDKLAIRFGYEQFPDDTDQAVALEKVLQTGYQKLALRYISDGDARPEGGMHPFAHLWDNGENAVSELEKLLLVRNEAMARFSAAAIRMGRPMATLEDVLVPLYFLHRYQTEAVSKLLAGVEYSYNRRDDWQEAPLVVRGELQKKALDTLLATISPGTLRIPESILSLLPPRPPGFPEHRELIRGHMDPAFDPLAAAEAAAEITVSLILSSERAARLIYFGAEDRERPDLDYVISRLIEVTWKKQQYSGADAEINRAVSYVVLENLLSLATANSSPMQVRAVAHKSLSDLRNYLQSCDPDTTAQQAANSFAIDLLTHYLSNPGWEYKARRPLPPPGSPIGSCSTNSTIQWRPRR